MWFEAKLTHGGNITSVRKGGMVKSLIKFTGTSKMMSHEIESGCGLKPIVV